MVPPPIHPVLTERPHIMTDIIFNSEGHGDLNGRRFIRETGEELALSGEDWLPTGAVYDLSTGVLIKAAPAPEDGPQASQVIKAQGLEGLLGGLSPEDREALKALLNK